MSEGHVPRTFTGSISMTTSAVDDDGCPGVDDRPAGTLTRAASEAKSAPDRPRARRISSDGRHEGDSFRMPPAKSDEEEHDAGRLELRPCPHLPGARRGRRRGQAMTIRLKGVTWQGLPLLNLEIAGSGDAQCLYECLSPRRDCEA
jgi:hypothetical protein